MKQTMLTIAVIVFVYGYLSDSDYHTMVDKPKKSVYTCSQIDNLSMGGWHPDIPKIEFDRCNYLKEKAKQDHARTNQI